MPKKARKFRTPKKAPHKLSRQRVWQIKKKKEGKCIICGKPRNAYAQHCDKCWRKIAGGNAWIPGKKGRPPNRSGGAGVIQILV